MDDLDRIGDILIDHDLISRFHRDDSNSMLESYESYKRANALLGYFSQLKDYNIEYDRLHGKVLEHRREILSKHKTVLTREHPDICKQLVVPPTSTTWYTQGIHKYKKVKNYSVYYYRRKIYIALEQESMDIHNIKRIVHAIQSLDKYYEIYDDTIAHFMRISDRFEQTMRKHFPDFIHL